MLMGYLYCTTRKFRGQQRLINRQRANTRSSSGESGFFFAGAFFRDVFSSFDAAPIEGIGTRGEPLPFALL